MIEIWNTRWTFYPYSEKIKDGKKIKDISQYHVTSVVSKRIPVKFLLNERTSYERAIAGLPQWKDSLKGFLQENGKLKFTIEYIKFIGHVQPS